MMEKKDRDSVKVAIAFNHVDQPISRLITALECLDQKDDQIVDLKAKIKRIRDTTFEMIAIQTTKIKELECSYIELDGSYMALEACNEKLRVKIMELEKK